MNITLVHTEKPPIPPIKITDTECILYCKFDESMMDDFASLQKLIDAPKKSDEIKEDSDG